MTKDEAREAIERGDDITCGTLFATKAGNGVYVNCEPDCRCSENTYATFEEFWSEWGHREWRLDP